MAKKAKEEVKKEEVKELASDKEIMEALVKDLVQVAQQCQLVMYYSSVAKPALKDALLLDSMCEEIVNTFIKPVEEKEDDAISEDVDS